MGLGQACRCDLGQYLPLSNVCVRASAAIVSLASEDGGKPEKQTWSIPGHQNLSDHPQVKRVAAP
jgi:hypothetical protein